MKKVKQLIELVAGRSTLQADLKSRKVEFENSIALDKAKLEDLMETEESLRADILEDMGRLHLSNIELEDYSVILNEKMTPQVVDANKVLADVRKNIQEFTASGVNIEDLISQSMEQGVVVTNKKVVLEINDIYSSLTGSGLDGMDIKKTKYITLKSK